MSFESKVMEILAKLAVGPRPPQDPFFEEANNLTPHLKKYGIYEADDEDFLHEPYVTNQSVTF